MFWSQVKVEREKKSWPKRFIIMAIERSSFLDDQLEQSLSLWWNRKCLVHKGFLHGAVVDKMDSIWSRRWWNFICFGWVGELPLTIQVKLLRTFKNDHPSRRCVKISKWMFASLRQRPIEIHEETDFCQDLFYRLNVIQIQTPLCRSAILARRDSIVTDLCFKEMQEEKLKSHVNCRSQEAIGCFWRSMEYPGNVSWIRKYHPERTVALEGGATILPWEVRLPRSYPHLPRKKIGILFQRLKSVPRAWI